MATMTAPIKSVALYFREGSSDKEYHASIEPQGAGYVVNFAYGRRGSSLTSGTKTSSPVDLAKAEKIYDKLVGEKTAKGYVPDGSGTPFAGTETANKQTGLLPMLLNPITEHEAEDKIEDDDWLMQEKLDGKRIMVRVKGDEVTASNRRGLSVGIPREIEDELRKFGDCVLDGELVGSEYILFDLLEVDELDFRTTHSCLSRYSMLKEIFDTFGSLLKTVKLVSTALDTDSKRSLYAALKKCEGVVFKHKEGEYKPGRPHKVGGGNQLKCKFWSSATCRVKQVNAKRSVSLELQWESGWVEVGNVTVPANMEIPKAGELVEVRYLYAYRNGSLYQPILLGVRDDVPADRMASLKFKDADSDEDTEEPFTPFAPVIEPEFAD